MPFYKRELSFGRGSKAEKPPKTEQPSASRALLGASAGHRTTWRDPGQAKALVRPHQGRAGRDAASPEPRPSARREEKRETSAVAVRAQAEGDRAGRQERAKLVGLKIGASQLAAARVHERRLGRSSCRPFAARSSRASSSAASCATPSALADALQGVLQAPQACLARAFGSASRTTASASARSTSRDRRSEAARQRDPVPRPGGAADPDRGGRPRLPGARRSPSTRRASRTRRVLLVVAYRELVDRYTDACRKAGIEVVGIDLEAFALLRALAEPLVRRSSRRRARRARRRLRSATTASRSPSPTAASASSRACSSGAAGR